MSKFENNLYLKFTPSGGVKYLNNNFKKLPRGNTRNKTLGGTNLHE